MEAGLPNIQGGVALLQAGNVAEPSGCFYTLGTNLAAAAHSSVQSPMLHGFNASYSNSIYGSSNTVTPLSRACIFCIKF